MGILLYGRRGRGEHKIILCTARERGGNLGKKYEGVKTDEL